jgi:hypothetical protein
VRDAQAREPAAGPEPVSASVRLLGPVGLDVDGRPCDLGPPKQRAVFAVLAVHAGQVVSTDRIIGEVWGDDAPESVISNLQVNVSRLIGGESPSEVHDRHPDSGRQFQKREVVDEHSDLACHG